MSGIVYLRAAVVSFVVATVVNYLLGVRFLFVSGVRFPRAWEVAMVFGVSLVGLMINQVALAAGVERMGWPLLVAKLFATSVVFFWNYGARRLFVFGAIRK
jgi:putative flippase GtrA